MWKNNAFLHELELSFNKATEYSKLNISNWMFENMFCILLSVWNLYHLIRVLQWFSITRDKIHFF